MFARWVCDSTAWRGGELWQAGPGCRCSSVTAERLPAHLGCRPLRKEKVLQGARLRVADAVDELFGLEGHPVVKRGAAARRLDALHDSRGRDLAAAAFEDLCGQGLEGGIDGLGLHRADAPGVERARHLPSQEDACVRAFLMSHVGHGTAPHRRKGSGGGADIKTTQEGRQGSGRTEAQRSRGGADTHTDTVCQSRLSNKIWLRDRLWRGASRDGGRRAALARTCAAANATAWSMVLTMSSKMPMACASAADTMSPVPMTWNAAAAPTRRGSRCVPPAPGSRPMLTSGSPARDRAVA